MSTPPPPAPRPPGPPKAPPHRPDVAARAEVIFDSAVELSEVDRERYLVAECGADSDLLERIRAHFADDTEGSGFLAALPMTPQIERQLAKRARRGCGEGSRRGQAAMTEIIESERLTLIPMTPEFL